MYINLGSEITLCILLCGLCDFGDRTVNRAAHHDKKNKCHCKNERYSVKGDIHKTVYTCRYMAHCLVNDYVADILVRDIYRGKYRQHLVLEGAVKISSHIVVAAKIGDIKAIYHYRLRTVILGINAY